MGITMDTLLETAGELAPVHDQLPVPTGDSLEAYVAAVNRLPVLSADEERLLARRYREEEDLEAARQLVLSHLRFVVQVARGYGGYGLPLADLIQEGNIGLMKAVKRFDPEQGVRLISFAIHWIRAEIHESSCATGGSYGWPPPRRSASCSSICVAPNSAWAG